MTFVMADNTESRENPRKISPEPNMPDDIPTLPIAFMNEDHAEAAGLLKSISEAIKTLPETQPALAKAFSDFVEHSHSHFEREEAAMRAEGFPAYSVHKAEHDRVLDWLDGAGEAVRSNALAAGELPRLSAEIHNWFVNHIRTMDSVTASWLEANARQ